MPDGVVEAVFAERLVLDTPEYNCSVPGCLKKATDVASRPDGKNVFVGLPAAIVSVSPYSLGGFGANHALRQNFVYLDLAVMQQPEAYIGKVSEIMGANGTITNEKYGYIPDRLHARVRALGEHGQGRRPGKFRRLSGAPRGHFR